MVERIVAYVRVSTAQQVASGPGIEAQRRAIEGDAEQRGATLIGRFIEVESGRCPDRPELAKAPRLASATLVIARLDRLSRNTAFLLTLRNTGGAPRDR